MFYPFFSDQPDYKFTNIIVLFKNPTLGSIGSFVCFLFNGFWICLYYFIPFAYVKFNLLLFFQFLKMQTTIIDLRPFSIIFIKRWVSLSPRLECSGAFIAHFSLKLLGSMDPPTSASKVVGIRRVSHHAQTVPSFNIAPNDINFPLISCILQILFCCFPL